MRRILLFLTLSLCILITACNDQTPPEVTTVTEAPEPTPYPLEINGFTFSQSPQRVVCLSPYLGEMVYEMGYGERIIGRSSYCDYPASITSAQDLGSSAAPDIDAILELKPDVVLTASPIANKDLFLLEQNNIPVLIFSTPQSLPSFSHIYEVLGLLFEGVFSGMDTGKTAYAPLENSFIKVKKDAESFVYITQNLTVAGGDTFENAVLSLFGENLAKDMKGYDFHLEVLLENQPHTIFLNNQYSLETLQNHDVFSQLDAVKENRVILVDNVYFERPSVRLVQLIEQVSQDLTQLKVTPVQE